MRVTPSPCGVMFTLAANVLLGAGVSNHEYHCVYVPVSPCFMRQRGEHVVKVNSTKPALHKGENSTYMKLLVGNSNARAQLDTASATIRRTRAKVRAGMAIGLSGTQLRAAVMLEAPRLRTTSTG